MEIDHNTDVIKSDKKRAPDDRSLVKRVTQ